MQTHVAGLVALSLVACGATGPQGTDGKDGLPGADGKDGKDGTTAVYGDGSAGDLVVEGTVDWTVSPPGVQNTQFASCTVKTGATLIAPSGVVVRCTKSLVIDGAIDVQSGIVGGLASLDGTSVVTVAPEAGVSLRAPFGGSSTGGHGGVGIDAFLVASLPLPTPKAGGGGAAAPKSPGPAVGGNGGGGIAFIVQAKCALGVQSVVTARGQDATDAGAGGGAGGIVVVGCGQSIETLGSIDVRGGKAGASDDRTFAGGGGGGGIVRLIAPSVSPGTELTQGGTGGDASIAPSVAPIFGGAGGGACGGDGGHGADATTSATSGGEGHILRQRANPAALL